MAIGVCCAGWVFEDFASALTGRVRASARVGKTLYVLNHLNILNPGEGVRRGPGRSGGI